ncbi:hypothetical protein P786_0655 [Enterococcus faecalis MD6]|nr:hypothetical protein P786_0655 [Enterococcus faecalis MD6]
MELKIALLIVICYMNYWVYLLFKWWCEEIYSVSPLFFGLIILLYFQWIAVTVTAILVLFI